ncbi:hypothetical protein A0J61_10589 [Choanephora cucurbitarum]|uniref:Uncharacterized protein n=1 Tax=Choanephora cucurbitarum TaxID=101091 RepID=A0A1C7MX17_9FUNG|nr:hypothetical protein A0J61_10589 [Choanephora cucurbitarum]
MGPFAHNHFQSPDTYRRMGQKNTKTTVKHNICSNACHMYPINDLETKKCPIDTCQAARYCNEAQVEAAREDLDRDEAMPLPELLPTRQLAYTSIGKAWTELYMIDNNAEMLAYRSQVFEQHRADIDIYRDIFLVPAINTFLLMVILTPTLSTL